VFSYSVILSVKYILAVCSQRIYLLKLLGVRGLPVLYLQRICYSIIISRLIYAISVWGRGGFLSAELTGRIDVFLRRLFRCGYTSTLLNIEDLLADADETLFIKVLRPGHCLHQLLPECKLVSMKLRPSDHSCQLPICKYVSSKRFLLYNVFLIVWKCSCCISFIFLVLYFLFFCCVWHMVVKNYLLTYLSPQWTKMSHIDVTLLNVVNHFIKNGYCVECQGKCGFLETTKTYLLHGGEVQSSVKLFNTEICALPSSFLLEIRRIRGITSYQVRSHLFRSRIRIGRYRAKQTVWSINSPILILRTFKWIDTVTVGDMLRKSIPSVHNSQMRKTLSCNWQCVFPQSWQYYFS